MSPKKRSGTKKPPKSATWRHRQPTKARRKKAAKNGQVTVAATKLAKAERGLYGTGLGGSAIPIEELRAQARVECSRPLQGIIGDAKVGLYPRYVMPNSTPDAKYAEAIAAAVERAEESISDLTP